jgi:hypothetical protein
MDTMVHLGVFDNQSFDSRESSLRAIAYRVFDGKTNCFPFAFRMTNLTSYFTDEEYTEVLEHFDELRNRSLKNSKTKTAVDKKDLTTFKRLKKEHYLKMMGNHFLNLPLGGTERFEERLDKFLGYHPCW